MDRIPLTIAQQLAEMASTMQQQRTGHTPRAVTVVLSEDTVVVTLHEALTPAEKALAHTPAGAAQVQEFHRQLFSNSCEAFKDEITRITGRRVREAAAEIEPATGAVMHAFTTGAMVQVYLLAQVNFPDVGIRSDSVDLVERADNEGLRVALGAEPQDDAALTSIHSG